MLAEFQSATGDFNATIASLNMLVETLKATTESLQSSVHSKDNAMAEEKSNKEKLENQMRGLSKLVEKKSKQSTIPKEAKKKGPVPKEQGNNGARRCDHPEIDHVLRQSCQSRTRCHVLFHYLFMPHAKGRCIRLPHNGNKES